MTQNPDQSLNHTLVKEVVVNALSDKGEGIALCGEDQLYIPFALIGDKLEVEVGEPFVKGSKRKAVKVIKYLEKSPSHNQDNLCPHFELCGGCQLQHLKYEEQLKLKDSHIDQALAEVKEQVKSNVKKAELSFKDLKRLSVVPSEQNSCRFKSIRYFAQDNNGKLISGFYQTRSHDVVAIEHCPMEPELFSATAKLLTTKLDELEIKAFSSAQSDSKCNYVRALTMRLGNNNELLVNLLMSQRPDQKLCSALADFAANHKISSFYVSVNAQDGNALFSNNLIHIYGSEYINKTILEHTFKVGANTFLQVNYDICQKLYQKAVAYAHGGLASVERLEQSLTVDQAQQQAEKTQTLALDLCCGVGTMSLALSDHFKRVIGVEIVKDSIEAAKQNALYNQVNNVKFIAGDITKVLPSILKDNEAITGVIADPSRVGLQDSASYLLGTKLKAPCNLSLIFCSLKALKRDLPILLKAGFKLDLVQGFDMFPHSMHVETLVLLSKPKTK